MLRRALISLLPLFTLTPLMAAETDSVATTVQKPSFLSRIISPVAEMFTNVDTTYIEPTHFKFQAMVQSKIYMESMTLSDGQGNSVRFSPTARMKIGPYAGWSLFFFGMGIDVFHVRNSDKGTDFDMSVYSLPFGIDFYYRKSGDNYYINSLELSTGVNTDKIHHMPFSGVESSVIGADMYFIFNHKQFSYPAVFNQSTRQKQSAGSLLAGLGFKRQTLRIDWAALNELAKQELNTDLTDAIDVSLLFDKVTYNNFSISLGYGYNWVPVRNLVIGGSLSLAGSYKLPTADGTNIFNLSAPEGQKREPFKLSDITVDGTARLGIAYWNDRWFAGVNGVGHTYNFSKDVLSANNIFGTINIYAGINFGYKKAYAKNGKKW